MIAHKNSKPPTKAEQERIEQMMTFMCPFCEIAGYAYREHNECHHMLSGNKRMGHWYSIPVCAGHHRGEWTVRQRSLMDPQYLVSISDGRKMFTRVFPTERQVWELVQRKLGLPAEWPVSKVLPRRVA